MQDRSALGRALLMVRDLRRRCPWDRVQTRETIRPYLVEEVFELDHAIAEGEPAAIREEVADLLLHLAWQLVLGEGVGVHGRRTSRRPRAQDAPAPPAPLRPRAARTLGTAQAARGAAAGRTRRPPPPSPAGLPAGARREHRLAANARAERGGNWPDLEGPARGTGGRRPPAARRPARGRPGSRSTRPPRTPSPKKSATCSLPW